MIFDYHVYTQAPAEAPPLRRGRGGAGRAVPGAAAPPRRAPPARVVALAPSPGVDLAPRAGPAVDAPLLQHVRGRRAQ